MARRRRAAPESEPKLGLDDIHPETAAIMRQRVTPGSRWAAYRNMALDSALVGHLQFLLVGPGCTFETPPMQYPADTDAGLGWRYRFAGWANLEIGKVEEEAP